jgi:hypothetical protein
LNLADLAPVLKTTVSIEAFEFPPGKIVAIVFVSKSSFQIRVATYAPT